MSTKPNLIERTGGRKFFLSVLSIVAITALGLAGVDASAFSAIAIVAAGYGGANAYIEGRHAGSPVSTPDSP
jgi:hypothetical protein